MSFLACTWSGSAADAGGGHALETEPKPGLYLALRFPGTTDRIIDQAGSLAATTLASAKNTSLLERCPFRLLVRPMLALLSVPCQALIVVFVGLLQSIGLARPSGRVEHCRQLGLPREGQRHPYGPSLGLLHRLGQKES
ncbi:hypothetical protein QBC46DRAFT_402518 [Diplogelasinospora grovesii]|uniref:Uncharacterized protein n=1 Tax=Diplogelasinospora grovesii TaxID=303347 RepID=A0AAN6NJA3_9PEZI|nr:hypothetical protein QBC46DRAFT_402518 [Diplogelasinospora grovesii]